MKVKKNHTPAPAVPSQVSGQPTDQLCSTLLMVRPASFGYNTQTAANNRYQQTPDGNTTAATIQASALREFDRYVSALKARDIDVYVIEDSPLPVKPDAVFPNNWFCTLPSGIVAIFPMFAPNRREEKRDEILEQLKADFKVSDFEDWSEYEAENFFLEGTGSMIFDHPNKTVYACISARTHKPLLQTFARAHGYRPVFFEASDQKGQPIYHTNVMMHIGTTYAVICLDAIKSRPERIKIAQELQSSGHEVIAISQEQVSRFAGNMMQVRNKHAQVYTLMSQAAYDSLTEPQRSALAIHSEPLAVDLNTIETIGGGSARCMVAEIFLEKRSKS